MSKPIEVILNEARLLLREGIGPNGIGPWDERVDAWVKDAADWSDAQPQQLGEQLDPGVEDRVSNLEQGVMSLAISVAGLQTLALQGMAAPKQPPPTRWQIAQDLDPEGELEILDGSKIKVKDVPIDPTTGMPEEEWAMKHCPCEVHEARRAGQRAGKADRAADEATGMYL